MRSPSIVRHSRTGYLPPAPTPVAVRPPAEGGAPRGIVHAAILGLVWLTFGVSSIVFSEPAPVDALLIGLTILLPVAGLVAITPPLITYLALWCVVAASGFIAATLSRDLAASTVFTAISLYLTTASFVLAAFVARAPRLHAGIILSGWMAAAVVAAGLALAGYFAVVPGAAELFTKYARASGPFKDPNVFGPFLVAPFLYALHLVLSLPWRRAVLPLLAAGVLALAVLLSFSRGAWINLAAALSLYGLLAYMTAQSNRQRERIASILLAGVVLVGFMTVLVVQDERIGTLLRERAALTQSYDVGPAGRFGGQEKAVRLILDNPLGIGAGQFALQYHHEEVHNVFLSMFLNAGWIGGLVYALVTILTLLIGLGHVLQANPARPLFLIVYAAFAATAFEGVVIDTDHWRSFYVLMALVWGMVFGLARPAEAGVRG